MFQKDFLCFGPQTIAILPQYIREFPANTFNKFSKCESNKTQQSGNKNGKCYASCFEDHHASSTFLLLSAIFCQKGNKLLSPFLESSQCRWSSRSIIRLFGDEKYSLFRRLRSRCGQLSDHKRLEQTVWFKIIKIFLYYKFNKGRWWPKRQQGKQLMHFKFSRPRDAELLQHVGSYL